MHNEPDISRFTHWVREAWSRRKWLAAGVFAVVAAAGVTLVSSLPDIYRATATVLVEEPRVDPSVAAELDRRLQLINQEILSRARLDAIIQRLGLYPQLRQQGSSPAAVERMRRDVQTEFKASSVAGGVGGTITLAVGYRGRDPQTVTRVANALAGLYLEEDQRIRERQASGNVQALARQLDSLKQTMDTQERELSSYQESHLGELPEQSEANVAALEQLHAELRSTSEERMRTLDRRNDVLRRLAELDGEGSGAPAPRSAPGRLERLREELADLQRKFSDRYPDVIRVKAEIAALESQPAAEAPAAAAPAGGGSSRVAARLRDELAEVDRQVALFRSDEARLRSAIDGYIQRLQNAPRRQQALQEISRDHQTTRELYDSLRKRYEQAQLDEGTQSGGAGRRFRILDSAVVPTYPEAPNRTFLLLAALAGALGLAAGVAALAEHLDNSFHDANDVRAFTRLPVLVSIPRMSTDSDVRSRRRRLLVAAVSTALAIGVIVHTVHGIAHENEALVSMLGRARS